jgi:hypothetical protein
MKIVFDNNPYFQVDGKNNQLNDFTGAMAMVAILKKVI